MEVRVKKVEGENATLIEVDLPEPLEPEYLEDIELPDVNYTKGVIISGRAPIWLYAYLVHYYHPASWIATYDPRLGGAVVVAKHCSDLVAKIGEVKR